MRNSVLLAAIAGVSITAWSPNAFADPFDLYIKNIDHQPVTVTLSKENSNCFETDAKQLGEVFENVAPGKQVLIHAWKKGGHGCNGLQGEFEVVFNPGVGRRTTQHFDFDSEGALELTTDVLTRIRANSWRMTITTTSIPIRLSKALSSPPSARP